MWRPALQDDGQDRKEKSQRICALERELSCKEKVLAEVCNKAIPKKSEVVQETLRLYFGARSGKVFRLPFVRPTTDRDRKHTELLAIALEWVVRSIRYMTASVCGYKP
jgi:hypothetical protein